MYITYNVCYIVPSGPPQNIQVSNLSSTSATITWLPPTETDINHRDGPTGYGIIINDGLVIDLPNITSYTLLNLKHSNLYMVRILARNSIGIAIGLNAGTVTFLTNSSSE